MTARIVMDDGGGPVLGSIETLLATPVSLSNQSDVGVLGWTWTLKDKPAGSAAVIASPFSPATSITPDVPGSYMIELLTYRDTLKTVLDGADSQIVGVRYLAPHPWRIPAAGETRQFDPLLGWKPEVNAILIDIRASLGGGGGGNLGIKFHLRLGDNLVVLADYQYIVKSPAPIIDAGASLTLSPGAQLVVLP